MTDRISSVLMETPPRTWGRRLGYTLPIRAWGNTPTHVGKTGMCRPVPRCDQKHPHARGEDLASVHSVQYGKETPPRTWGRPAHPWSYESGWGNTPTHVGKTFSESPVTARRWKHPHARGEDGITRQTLTEKPETPPRTWGRRSGTQRRGPADRNTPTHVGKTFFQRDSQKPARKHPHARGEDRNSIRDGCQSRETPPRTWGRLAYGDAPAP